MNWTEEQLTAFELNRLGWDERVETHWKSEMYQRDVAKLKAGRPCLHSDHIEKMGDVSGKSLIHLQCHMGMETHAWAMLGANAVGLDYSLPAIEKARMLGSQLELNTQFICANVYDAVGQVDQSFDIVFVSVGALIWLPDVQRWADVVSKLLKPGGCLYMNEVHPFVNVFDDHDDVSTEHPAQSIVVKYPYLNAPVMEFDDPGTYADRNSVHQHTKSIEYNYSLGEILNALIAADMVIDRLDESNHCMWPRFKIMQQVEEDQWTTSDANLNQLPHTFTLQAHRK